MRVFEIAVGFFEDEAVLVAPATLDKYPAENKRTLEIKHEKLTTRARMEIDALLNKRTDLFHQTFDGRMTPGIADGFLVARAQETVSRLVKAWAYKDAAGTVTESVTDFSLAGIGDQDPELVLEIASRIEYLRLPPLPELEKAGEG